MFLLLMFGGFGLTACAALFVLHKASEIRDNLGSPNDSGLVDARARALGQLADEHDKARRIQERLAGSEFEHDGMRALSSDRARRRIRARARRQSAISDSGRN